MPNRACLDAEAVQNYLSSNDFKKAINDGGRIVFNDLTFNASAPEPRYLVSAKADKIDMKKRSLLLNFKNDTAEHAVMHSIVLPLDGIWFLEY